MSQISKILAMFLLLALFAASALAGGPGNAFEVKAMQQMADLRATWPGLTAPVDAITALGGAPVTLGVVGTASLVLLLRRAYARALMLAVTALAERQLVDALKTWIGRPRPSFAVDWLPASLAYPSGHAANSMTAFLATAMIAAPTAYRRQAAIAALALSITIGFSRIYLGVHWPSDVIGGWALGLAAVGATLAIGERSGALRLEPQHQIVGWHRLPGGKDEAT